MNDTKDLELKKLQDRVEKLEEMIKTLSKRLENNMPEIKEKRETPQKIYNSEGKKQTVKPVTKKGEINVIVTNDLNVIDDAGNVYIVGEEMIVQNILVLGDKLLVLTKEGRVQTIKVSQRAKRVREEALVTEKEGVFYAVSKFATHQLINYDVQKRGVMKGFEVKILLPKDFEKDAKVVLIDFVESSGGEVLTKNDNNSMEFRPLPNSNIRIVEDDDLV